jgi:hypothetical protein
VKLKGRVEALARQRLEGLQVAALQRLVALAQEFDVLAHSREYAR